jgi:hypothetical protein
MKSINQHIHSYKHRLDSYIWNVLHQHYLDLYHMFVKTNITDKLPNFKL